MREWLQRLPPAGRVLTIAILATLGYASWWWLDRQEQDTAEQPDAARTPDSYFRELSLVRHDESGDPETSVRAKYAEHFEDEAWIYLQDLEASGLVAGPDWRLTARNGRLDDAGEQLEAWNEVVLARRSGDGIRLETERLTVDMQQELATTDEPVAIVDGQARITGRGLWASLADDRLRIESNVEAHYAR